MKVLVDTGATNSIICQTSLSKIRHHQIYPVQQQFSLANKTLSSITGYVTLETKIQNIKTYTVIFFEILFYRKSTLKKLQHFQTFII